MNAEAPFRLGPPLPGLYFASKPVDFPVLPQSDPSVPPPTTLQGFLHTKCPSVSAGYRSPWWLFNSGHLQTLYAAFAGFAVRRILYRRTFLRLSDGGTLGLDFAPQDQSALNDSTPTVVVLHGLTGGSEESYVHSILEPLCRPAHHGGLGYRAVVVNARGCGGVPITSPRFYNAGHTDDLRQALMYIAHLLPDAPLLGLGFSMGANIMTRYLAEEGCNSRISAACALGCPWNLARNNKLLNRGFFNRRIYAETLGANVIALLKSHADSFSRFPDSPTTKALMDAFLLERPTMEDYDNAFTRLIAGEPPLFPMKTATEYYEWASSHKVVSQVAVPYLSINAADDPIVQEVPTDCGGNGWVAMLITAQGGHLGWFDHENYVGGVERWVQKPVLEFLRATAEGLVHVRRGKSLYVEDGFIRETDRSDLGCKAVEYDCLLDS